MPLSTRSIAALAMLLAIGIAPTTDAAEGVAAAPGAADGKHFDPNGNLASTFPIEPRKGVSATLPFAMPDAFPPRSAGD